jgi:ParB family chromosome partitioning protein
VTSTTSTTRTIQQIDPRTLLANVNVRGELDLTPEFVASIRRRGILQAIVAVRTADGEIRVKFGHRRTAAAIEAGLETVPVDVIGDEGTDKPDQIERILAQYDENQVRTGLTNNDTLAMVEQLRLLDVSAAEIARQSPLTKAQVANAVKVLKSDAAKAAHDEHQLTIDQAALLAEFDDNEDDLKAALHIARVNPQQLTHTCSRLREARKERAEKAAWIAANLEPLGLPIIDRPAWNDKTVKDIDRLTTTAGVDLTPELHADCPSHAVFADTSYGWFRPDGTMVGDDDEIAGNPDAPTINRDEDDYRSYYKVGYACTAPLLRGHLIDGKTPDAPTNLTGEQAAAAHEAKLEEKRRVVKMNKEWDAAEPVRRKWVAENIANRRTPPKGAAMFVAQALITDTYIINGQKFTVDGYGWLPKDSDTWLDVTSEGRANVVALIMILAAFEDQADRGNWRYKNEKTRRYLLWLQENKYELSNVERLAANLEPIEPTDVDAKTGSTIVVDGTIVAQTTHVDLTEQD